tara:strand:- start:276 stop:701 length:426 start_codon:yes stop_codon:yes gene_type:complete
MATLTPTLTLASTDISASETLNLTLTDTLSVLGPVETKRQPIAASATDLEATNVILLAASYSKSYVLLYNTSTAASGEIITVGTAVATGGTNDEGLLATASQMSLAPGEWAFFPWESDINLAADATTGTPVLEIRVFQTAA